MIAFWRGRFEREIRNLVLVNGDVCTVVDAEHVLGLKDSEIPSSCYNLVNRKEALVVLQSCEPKGSAWRSTAHPSLQRYSI
jgi:hypothetical protein